MPAATFLLYTSDYDAAEREVRAKGGRVTQNFDGRLFEARFPGDCPENLGLSSPAGSAALDEDSKLLARAWAAMQEETARQAAGGEPPLPWNTPGKEPPRNPGNDPRLRRRTEDGRTQAELMPPATSKKMTGKIAIGVVFVSGSKPNLKISDDEQGKITTQLMLASRFLTTSALRANITFVWDFHSVRIDATPNPNCKNEHEPREACERVFRDPALDKLGFPAGEEGIKKFINGLLHKYDTDWGYAVFFTKYPMDHFAYVGRGGNAVFMRPDNGTWGPSRINQTFAHQTCRVFGAADEYAPCSCGGSGIYNFPNYNCEQCRSPFPKSRCLMNQSDLTICCWTQGQLGWLPPLAQGRPFPIAYNNGMHVFYRDANGHISDSWYDGRSWRYQDLHALAQSARLAKSDPVAVMAANLNVFYRDTTNAICQFLLHDGKWTWHDLNAVQPGAPRPKGNPTAVVDAFRTLHVIYRDINNEIVDIYWSSGAWKSANLSDLTKSPYAQGDPMAVAFATSATMKAKRSVHVFYRDVLDTIWELYCDLPGTWKCRDLGKVWLSPIAKGDPVAVVVDGIGNGRNELHVYYQDDNDHVAELWSDGSWHYNDMNDRIKLGTPAPCGPLAATTYPAQIYVFYRDVNYNISTVFWQKGQWYYANMTKNLSAPAAGGDPLALTFDNPVSRLPELQVFYPDTGDHVSNMFFNTGWDVRDVTEIAPAVPT